VTAERYDGHDWPATISVGPGYYGLRLPQEYGTIVEYVDARSLYGQDRGTVPKRAVTPLRARELGSTPSLPTTAGPALGAER